MAASKNRRRLDELAYRCAPGLLDGSAVYLREFPDGVKSLWRLLERNYQDRMGRQEVQAPHSIVTTALRCLTGGYAFFDPGRGFLVTRAPIDDDTLCDAFTLMSRLAAGDDLDDIDLGNPDRLAERIAETPQQQRLLADYLHRNENGQPDAEAWVYRSATWDLARRLTERPWCVDGLEISFRPDSEGGFIAWDQPWSNKAGTAHALARCRMAMKTMPNIADPLILVSASATRVKSGMAYSRTVLVEQEDPKRPIIQVEMAGRARVRTISRMALQTLSRLGMDHSALHGIHERVRQENQAEQEALARGAKSWYPPGGELGRIRPIHSKNYKFPIGRGVGMHFLRELDKHIRAVFGAGAKSPQIFFDTQGFKRLDKNTDGLFAKPEDVARSLRTMGSDHLRLVCLWYKDENRRRMIRWLGEAYGLDARTLDPAEGVPIALHEDTVSVVFHKAETFLTHGPNAGRESDLASITSLKPAPGILVGVWAETDYDSRRDEELPGENEQDAAEDPNDSTAPCDDEDAKYRARRTLAGLGIASQFITDRKPSKRPQKKEEDHQAIFALLDMNRSLGIVDRRIDNVMVDPIGPYKADGIAHCGIHVRRQSRQRGDKAAKICVTAAVLKPPAGDTEAWTLHGWSYTHPQWQPYHLAQTAYHSLDYPAGKLTEFVDDNQGHKKVARAIDQALGDLAHYLGGTPYTVTVDGLATRRLWDGLHNNKQGRSGKPGTTWLPGHTQPVRDRPIAVIRINKDTDEVPRPIAVTRLDPEGTMLGDPDNTTNLLYRVETDFGAPVWHLVTVPHQFDGAGAGRLGDTKTRWTADHGSSVEGERRKNEMRANWYTMTATEIYVIPRTEDIPADALARTTARLCHQSLAWTNRTRYPVQLHAALQMDKDHPQYRRSALGEDQAADDVGEPEIDDSLAE
jgi:hypothetical protein